MPDLGQRHQCHDMIRDPVVLLMDLKLFLTGLRQVQPMGQILHISAHCIHINPAVRHL